MKIKRRIEIEVHTDRVLIAGLVSETEGTCLKCGARMLGIGQAARFAGIDTKAIQRLVEIGRLHFQLTPAGFLLICPGSLWTSAE